MKSVKMLNSATSKLNHVLTIRKDVGDHVGLGYTGENSGSNTVFVEESRAKKLELVQKKTETRSVTNIRTPRGKCILICHYCEHIEHITLHYF